MTKQNKKLSGFIACIVTLALLTGLVFSALDWWTDKGPSTWGKKEETEKEQVDAGGGGIMAPVEDGVQAMGLSVTKLSREEYGDYGIMPIADTAFTIKASYTGDVTYKELDWAIKWKSGASGQWGNGKTLSEYATISPSQDTLTLTITVKQAFGEQIIITATNRANPDVTKSATLDYAKRVTGVTFKVSGLIEGNAGYKFGSVKTGEDSAKLEMAPTYTYSDVYTVDDTFSVSKYELFVNPDWITQFKETISGNKLYTGAVKTFVDAIDTTGKKINVGTSIPDITVKTILFKQLGGESYTSSADLDNNLMILFATAYKDFSTMMQPVFGFNTTITGEHSTFSVEADLDHGKYAFGFGTGSFGNVASAGSLNFDHESLIA